MEVLPHFEPKKTTLKKSMKFIEIYDFHDFPTISKQ